MIFTNFDKEFLNIEPAYIYKGWMVVVWRLDGWEGCGGWMSGAKSKRKEQENINSN